MELTLNRKPGLAEQIADRLTEAIVSGQLAAGDRLIELDLADQLGVSRAPLREAMRELVGTGLVVHHSGRGVFVAKPTEAEMAEMSVFRGIVEGSAARLLASERNAAALDRLDAIRARVEAAVRVDDVPAFLRMHWDLHQSICIESGNRFLLQSWNSVSKLIRVYFQLASLGIDPQATVAHNRVYIETLREGTPEVAEQVLRSQIILQAFRVLKRPLPDNVAGYVTTRITDQGTVEKFNAAH